MDIEGKIESVLFVASKPLSYNTIAKALGISVDDTILAIDNLLARYNSEVSGIHILKIDDDVQMASNPKNTDVIDQFIRREITEELTKAQLETLTVIAYRGPITRPELEQIRGVNCSLILRNLLLRGLIEEREDEASVLSAYSLSFEALRHLGISTVNELPEFETLRTHTNLDSKIEDSENSVV